MDTEWQKQLEESYLKVHEAAAILEISDQELLELVRQHKVPIYHIAGAFLRFKKEDIHELKIKWRIERELFPPDRNLAVHHELVDRSSFTEKLADFWYFNDFYVICSSLVIVLLYFILTSP